MAVYSSKFGLVLETLIYQDQLFNSMDPESMYMWRQVLVIWTVDTVASLRIETQAMLKHSSTVMDHFFLSMLLHGPHFSHNSSLRMICTCLAEARDKA